MVVSCKSWQSGFAATRILAQLRGEAKNPNRRAELQFRELWMPRWAAGFRRKIEEITGEKAFTYCLAVTRLRGDASAWTTDATISQCLGGNPFRFLTLEQMWGTVLHAVTTTPAPSEMGRLAQLLKAAGLTAPVQIVPPSGPQPGSLAEAEEFASLLNGHLPHDPSSPPAPKSWTSSSQEASFPRRSKGCTRRRSDLW